MLLFYVELFQHEFWTLALAVDNLKIGVLKWMAKIYGMMVKCCFPIISQEQASSQFLFEISIEKLTLKAR